jgi:hypothetical protein
MVELVAVLAFLFAPVLLFLVMRRDRRSASATVDLDVDDWGVRRTLADGRSEEVAWDELVEVELAVAPRGARFERRRYVLSGPGERGCIVPEDLARDHGVIEHIARLPGFDHRRLEAALAATRTGLHPVWARSDTT